MEGSGEVHVDRVLPLVEGDLLERGEQADAGAGDQHGDRPEVAPRRCECRVDGITIGHVGDLRRPGASVDFDGLRDLRCCVAVAVEHDDPTPGTREVMAGRLTDPRSAARHQCDARPVVNGHR